MMCHAAPHRRRQSAHGIEQVTMARKPDGLPPYFNIDPERAGMKLGPRSTRPIRQGRGVLRPRTRRPRQARLCPGRQEAPAPLLAVGGDALSHSGRAGASPPRAQGQPRPAPGRGRGGIAVVHPRGGAEDPRALRRRRFRHQGVPAVAAARTCRRRSSRWRTSRVARARRQPAPTWPCRPPSTATGCW